MIFSLAVIPTLAIYGPLALLALLVPALFSGLTIWSRRWARALAALSAMSAFVFAHAYLRGSSLDSVLQTRLALWLILGLIAGAFALLAAVRQLRSRPLFHRSDGIVLGAATIVLAGLAIWCAASGGRPTSFPAQELIVLGSACAAALIVLTASLWVHGHSMSAEFVWLVALFAGCCAAASERLVRHQDRGADRIVWAFRIDEPGIAINTPLVATDNLIVAAAQTHGLQSFGVVYSLNRSDRAVRWRFNADFRLKPVFSSPCLANGRLYFGEGLHSDKDCRLYCLDAATGQLLWEFPTTSHVESSPVLANGHVFFGAGDDGLYCLDATTGKPVWHFEGLHIDANPAVHSGRVFAGSTGASANIHTTTELFALDTASGKPIWRLPVNLSSFARPSIFDGAVYFGLHSGDLDKPAAIPAGAVVSLDAERGRQVWRTDLPDGVFTQPLVDREAVIVGCRDGHVYSLDRGNGHIRWSVPLGSAVLASPAGLIRAGRLTVLYAVTREGMLVRLDPATGSKTWTINVVRDADGMTGKVLASPVVVEERAGRRIYQAVGLSNGLFEHARVYCFSDDD